MDSEGYFVSLEDVEDLLRWQYKHLVELDDFLCFKNDSESLFSYSSLFLKDRIQFNKTFVGETILRFNSFRRNIGANLEIKVKPINDFIEGIGIEEAILTDLKKDYDNLGYGQIYFIQTHHVWRLTAQLRAVLTTVLDFILDREFAYYQNVNSDQGLMEIRKKLLLIETDKIKVPSSCLLRDSYRDKELAFYQRLEQYYTLNVESVKEAVKNEVEARPVVNLYCIRNNGDANVINTGDQAAINVSDRSLNHRESDDK